MGDSDGEDREKKMWTVDPSIFKPGPQDTKLRSRIAGLAKSIGRSAFFLFLFIYPLTLVISGILYGGLVFWSLTIGSLGVIGLILWKGGYAGNFSGRNPSLKRQIPALFIAFLMALGFYAGLIILKIWLLPIVITILVLSLAVTLRKTRL